MLAIMNNHLHIIQYFFQTSKIKDTLKTYLSDFDDHYTAFIWSIHKCDITTFNYLLSQMTLSDIKHIDKYGNNALMLACQKGDLEKVKILLEYPKVENIFQLTDKNNKGMNAFMWACRSYNVDLVRYLFNFFNNIDILNTKDKDDWSCLDHACVRDSKENIYYLVYELNQNLFKKDSNNKNSFIKLVEAKRYDTIEDLIINKNLLFDEYTLNYLNEKNNKLIISEDILKIINLRKLKENLENTLDNKNIYMRQKI